MEIVDPVGISFSRLIAVTGYLARPTTVIERGGWVTFSAAVESITAL
jgi:hypothetical protein